MELTIAHEKKSHLLKRTEVMLQASYTTQKTPSRAEMLDAVSKKKGVDPKTVAIAKIQAGFGASEATVTAHVYESESFLQKFEPKPIIKRHQPKVAKTA